MHPLQNGTQTAERPTPKNPLGDPGFFTESGKNGQPSIPGADFFNAQIEEFKAVLGAAGLEFRENTYSHLANAISAIAKNAASEDLVGLVVPDSTSVIIRERAFLADGSSYKVSDYPKLMSKVQGTAMMVEQSFIDVAPEQYAACYGISDDGLVFSVPNYPLRPHLAATGVFGAVGTTIEDQIQNITGKLTNASSAESLFASSVITAEGAFGGIVTGDKSAFSVNTSNTQTQSFNFDASRIARTGLYTEVNSSFLNFYIIHGESSA